MREVSQEKIVFGIAVALAVVFLVTLPSFRAWGNLLVLFEGSAVLGILAIGMGIVVIARGIDISQVAVMAVSAGVAMQLVGRDGVSEPLAILVGLAVALGLGAFNGFLVAFVEMPALFATLGTMLLFFNGARTYLIDGLIVAVPPEADVTRYLGQGRPLGIPMPVIVFAAVLIVAGFFLSRMVVGRFVYAHGDNPEGASLTGLPTRPLTLLVYMLSAALGFLGGLVQAGMVAEVDMQIVLHTLIFEVILIVVLGGISLVGGRGGVASVLAGTLLVGVVVNAMTLMDLSNEMQAIMLGVILLAAIVLDNQLHPRDEETVKQGD